MDDQLSDMLDVDAFESLRRGQPGGPAVAGDGSRDGPDQLPPPPLSPLRDGSEEAAQLPPPPLSPLSDSGDGSEEAGGAAAPSSSSSESESEDESSSSSSSSSDSSSESESDDSSDSSESSDWEPEGRRRPAAEDALEAHLWERLRFYQLRLQRMEEKARRQRRLGAQWLRGNIEQRFAAPKPKPSIALLRQVQLKQTYKRTFRV